MKKAILNNLYTFLLGRVESLEKSIDDDEIERKKLETDTRSSHIVRQRIWMRRTITITVMTFFIVCHFFIQMNIYDEQRGTVNAIYNGVHEAFEVSKIQVSPRAKYEFIQTIEEVAEKRIINYNVKSSIILSGSTMLLYAVLMMLERKYNYRTSLHLTECNICDLRDIQNKINNTELDD